MEKFIVFEGISGSGKSSVIEEVAKQINDVTVLQWFDNKYAHNMLANVEQNIVMSRDMFSLAYALEFYGKYKYCIEPLVGKKNILLHRYIYTPITHDFVRGTTKDLLFSWYMSDSIRKPDDIIFLNTPPEIALRRILSYRKPSFYECGLDVFFWDDLTNAKCKYKNNEFSSQELSDYFIKFQTLVYNQYLDVFANMDNIFFVDYRLPLCESMGKIIKHIF